METAGPGSAKRGAPPGWLYACLLAAAVLLAYAPALPGPFFLDDSGTVTANASIRSLPALVPPEGSSVAGRPFANASFALCYALAGPNPAWFRLGNVFIHLLAAFFLMGLVKTALEDRERFPGLGQDAGAAAFFSALVFALSPLQLNAVAYVTQRVESLSAMLGLAALLCAARGFSSERKSAWHLAAALCLILAAGVKETMAAMPLVIWLYDVVVRGERPGRALGRSPLLYGGAAASLLLLAALVATGRQAATVHSPYTWWGYFLVQPGSIGLYLRLFVLPAGLCFDRWGEAAGFAGNLAWGVALAAAFLYALIGCIRRRPAAFLVAWFFLALAPSSSFYPLADPAAEYRAYPALAPLSVLACAAVFLAARRLLRRRAREAAAFVLVLACAALFFQTRQRGAVFASAGALWEEAVAAAPHNPRALVNLGRARAAKGDYGAAVLLYRRALEADPAFPKVWANLGYALLRSGEPGKAEEALRESLALDAGNPAAWAYLGSALLDQGRTREARESLARALALYPGFPTAEKLLRRAENQAGKTRPDAEEEGEP